MRSARARTTAATAAVALIIGGLTLAAPALADDQPDPDCDAAGTIEQAALAAASCETEIAVTSEHTPWTTTYATPSGALRTESSSTAVRTDINGSWEPIDVTLIETAQGIQPAAAVQALVFSDGTPGQPMATMTIDGHTLTMDAPVALTAPIIDGSTLTYPQVLPGVDLVLAPHPDGTGFSEVLRVETPEAAANPALVELQFALKTTTGLTLASVGDGFVAQDASGEDIFVSPAPIMWDSASTELPPTQAAAVGAHSAEPPAAARMQSSTQDAHENADTEGGPALQPADGDTVAAMDTELSADALTVEPDQDLLTDPDTVYPVYIDPSVDNGVRNGRTIARAGFPTDTSFYNFSGDQGLGYCSTSGGCDRNGAYRMFFTFNDLPAVQAADADEIIEASFSIYGHHSWSCTGTGVELWRTSIINSSTSWNNQPDWVDLLQTKTLSHKDSCGTQRWIEWDVTDAAEHMASADNAHVTFGMQTTNETSMASSWQRYRGDVIFSVTYSRTPTAPTGLTVAGLSGCSATPLYIRDSTPHLSWHISDPDGGNVKGRLAIVNRDTGNTVWSLTSAAHASGSEVSFTLPAGEIVNNGSYEFRVTGLDIYTGATGPTTACRFVLDTTAPAAPEIRVSGISRPAQYPEDQVSGGYGLTGRFRIDGASDVVSFKYSFNGDSLNQSVSAEADGSGVAAGIDFTPNTVGSQRLLVVAVDRAGWVSATTMYRFSVNHTSETAIWRLDEGTGTTASDSAPTSNPNPLSVGSSTQWVPGITGAPTDTALRFDSTSDYAQASRPAVRTSESYTITAFVKLDTLGDDTQTIVSQAGQQAAAFQLGTIPGCASAGGATCWFAQVKTQDTTSGNTVTVLSESAATTNQWLHLTATVDLTSNKLNLYICEPAGQPLPAADPENITGGVKWTAGGKTQIGRTYINNTSARHFPGTIDHVRIYDNVLPEHDIRRSCGSTLP